MIFIYCDFREYREKINVETNNDELRYNERKYYIFDDYATMEANVHTNVTLDPDKVPLTTVTFHCVTINNGRSHFNALLLITTATLHCVTVNNGWSHFTALLFITGGHISLRYC